MDSFIYIKKQPAKKKTLHKVMALLSLDSEVDLDDSDEDYNRL